MAPLWNLTYSDQLQMKDEWISYVVSRYFAILKEQQATSRTLKSTLALQRPTIHKITPSVSFKIFQTFSQFKFKERIEIYISVCWCISVQPILHQYRNKDVYMVRPGIDGDPKTVGHIVGRSSGEKYVCVPPVDVVSPPQHIQVAAVRKKTHYILNFSKIN